ncbi:hypothetical protein DRN70_03590, partial [Methanosarcinales archaeon]
HKPDPNQAERKKAYHKNSKNQTDNHQKQVKSHQHVATKELLQRAVTTAHDHPEAHENGQDENPSPSLQAQESQQKSVYHHLTQAKQNKTEEERQQQKAYTYQTKTVSLIKPEPNHQKQTTPEQVDIL